MYRSIHPFRSAAMITAMNRSAQPTGDRARFFLDLAAWLDRLTPANRATSTAATDTVPVAAPPAILPDRRRPAA